MPQHLFWLVPADRKTGRCVMDLLLLLLAWIAGGVSLFMVLDMIAGDLAARWAERTALRPPAQRLARARVQSRRR
jgi:hypothetical protein